MTENPDVLPAHRFDERRLEDWLAANLEGFAGPMTVTEFKGGQSNPTYRLTTPGASYVLRRKPPGTLLPSAHAVDREYRIMHALAETGVPVPRTYLLCEDESIVGTMFYVMDFLDGRILFDPRLPEVTSTRDRAAMFDAMNEVIAALHTVDYQAVGLGDFGREGGYVARQIGRWSKQYKASETETIDAMERLMEWLPAHLPAHDETTLVHGDYRLDNLIFHPTEPRVIGVLDWEIATLGNPLADFAYHVMAWRVSPDEFRGLREVDIESLGIPNEAAYTAAYAQRTGREALPDWEFYMAYNLFRMAAILQGIMGRVRDGTAANPEAARMGALVRPLATLAWAQAEKIGD
jgi:aminoglycoside phosphotransferase (APT) family kinase protein